MTTAAPQNIQPTTASERNQIVARLADLQAKQEAATGWGAAVGAREEEIRSLESRLLRIDSMTAPPSTETPRHTATPWRASKCGYLMGTDDSEGAKGREVQVGKIGDFFDKQLLPFNKDRWQADLEFIVTAANSHAALTARVAELEAALRPFADFADPRNTIPPDTVLTAGSPMARKQITMANCYAARAALEAKP